ncbi:hypothetical protein SAMN05428953_12328 [Mesorhizobium muleiense]|uniref:Uncharacterized protein n=1 Tax=Mesorhizobium muleiense TaxID=1004279 RepID=A0A1G9FUK4_9HYPH|nr:hypothetical protein SAMN05428953_12328 [Mesorhizobium muleiense]
MVLICANDPPTHRGGFFYIKPSHKFVPVLPISMSAGQRLPLSCHLFAKI